MSASSASAPTPAHPDLFPDPEAAAGAAGLRYVPGDEPGIARRRCGRGFAFRDARGLQVDPDTAARIRGLAIPPAWREVWICADPRGHLQATGLDARGRKQYRYHPRWTELRSAQKFLRLAAFGRGLPALRARLEAQLRRRTWDRDKASALVAEIIQRTLIRVGNSEYERANETYGITTLRPEHVTVSRRRVRFDFVGKGKKEREVILPDPRIARQVGRCLELGGDTAFSYRHGGRLCRLTSDDVNRYLRDVFDGPFTAKDFRTWGASALAFGLLRAQAPPASQRAAKRAVLAAIDTCAEHLGNTRATCRSSYVDPMILDAYQEGALPDVSLVGPPELAPPERGLANLLRARHAPNA